MFRDSETSTYHDTPEGIKFDAHAVSQRGLYSVVRGKGCGRPQNPTSSEEVRAFCLSPTPTRRRTSGNLFTNQLTIEKMKKLFVLLLCTVALASCSTQRIIPKAVNTVNTAQLADLNLTRGDYEVLNTIESEATIYVRWKGPMIEISGDDFALRCIPNKKGGWDILHTGILMQGYLSGDYIDNDTTPHPENIVRKLAIYRLVNIAKQTGGDAVIEPTIATNIEQTDNRKIVYKTTATAKVIKIKTDR